MKTRINQFLHTLNQDLYEREEVIQLALLATLAGESIFLLGPPGVAKSLIARRLKTIFKGEKSFEYLMNRFSTPDEIFGPIAISKLKNEDKYERLTDKYLPWADIVFLDEIWKAGPSIQNALLTVVNEKIYRNGAQEISIPLKGLIAASNELPAKGEGLEALWDRFIVRYLVHNISSPDNFNDFLKNSTNTKPKTIDEKIKITDKEFQEWQLKIETIKVSDETLNVINVVRHYINDYNEKIEASEEQKTLIYVSDRRWKKIVRLLKTSAFLNNRQEIDLMDCFLIAHTIWSEVEQIDVVKDFVQDAIQKHGYSLKCDLKELKEEIEDLKIDMINEISIEKTITYYEPKEIPINNTIFYEILDKKNWFDNHYNPDYRYIKKDNYDQLGSEKYSHIDIFNKNGHEFWNSRSLKAAVLEDMENQIYIQEYDGSGKGIRLNLRKNRKSKKEKITQRPHEAIIEKWNRQIKELHQMIDEKVKFIEDYKKNELGNLKENLFVNKELAYYVETNLNQTLTTLLNKKTGIQNIKEAYDQL